MNFHIIVLIFIITLITLTTLFIIYLSIDNKKYKNNINNKINNIESYQSSFINNYGDIELANPIGNIYNAKVIPTRNFHNTKWKLYGKRVTLNADKGLYEVSWIPLKYVIYAKSTSPFAATLSFVSNEYKLEKPFEILDPLRSRASFQINMYLTFEDSDSFARIIKYGSNENKYNSETIGRIIYDKDKDSSGNLIYKLFIYGHEFRLRKL